jgi:hypothetical protein
VSARVDDVMVSAVNCGTIAFLSSTILSTLLNIPNILSFPSSSSHSLASIRLFKEVSPNIPEPVVSISI